MVTDKQEAYCTLLMSDVYLPGAMVLAHSLRDNGSKKQLAILVTLDSLQNSTIDELRTVYDNIIPVDRIFNQSPANLYLMNRPDLVSTFTKIALWRQTQFRHIVYVDADIVALRAPDELFDSPYSFAAVPDIGWPDCFNSGVLSLKPNMGDYYALLALAERGISFDGADQGLLNMHFREWERLSFTYNCTPSGNYQYVPAYRHFQSSISMIHYIGNDKPWITGREHKGATGVYEELLGRWWAVYDKHYRLAKTAYISEQASDQSRTVQQYVTGEVLADGIERPEAHESIVEPSLIDKPTDTKEEEAKAAPPVLQRRYSVDWDPVHQPPPPNSRPEASNFPHEVYNMSADPSLFQAPKNPEPPKGMYYEVPSKPPAPERPKPIFPWETNQPKPTRVFPGDVSTAPSETAFSATTDDDDTQTDTTSPSTPTIQSNRAEPFASFNRNNAWDDVPEIERYVSSLPQNRRGKVQVLPNNSTTGPLSPAEAVHSPSLEDPYSEGQQRRPSMKLTDFPTEIERPSLPVTPAPMRRPSFWGAERDAQGDLPGAEGVPEQSEWDPSTKLAELQQRQSEVLAQSPASPGRVIPDREMPSSAKTSISEIKEDPAGETQIVMAPGTAPVTFRRLDLGRQPLDFSGAATGDSLEKEPQTAMGPTEP